MKKGQKGKSIYNKLVVISQVMKQNGTRAGILFRLEKWQVIQCISGCHSCESPPESCRLDLMLASRN
jgi:hypothetical protein